MSWSEVLKPIHSGAKSLMKGVAGAVGWLNPSRLFKQSPASKEFAFTMAFVGLAAKMAKADGIAVEVETQAFESCFYVPPEERANLQRVYQLASKDIAGFELYAERIARMLKDDPALLKDVFECLFNIAAADGILHQGEEAFLRSVAEKFGYDETDYRRVRSLFVHDPSSPYVVLDLKPDATDEEVKARRKELVRENHPDKLAASGVPQEFLVLADRKLAAINAAYDEIMKVRESHSREKASG